ncbi:MAG TPA: RsmD family RNA methyltransferase [Candidatus Saccharimonadales bacterium]|nr:RsmD family RNA methyltransferase [Candidatus Saccharimonadales bacterium]
MNIRVTSGLAKNKKLVVPEIENIRVVQDIAKLALFSIIGDRVVESECLDLYCGSGNLGIEALSRGASWCDFVDENGASREAVGQNILECGFSEHAEFYLKDAVKYVVRTDKKYNLVFADPFYETVTHRFLIKNIKKILKPKGLVAFFHGKNLDMAKLIDGTDLKIVTERHFGASYLTILS